MSGPMKVVSDCPEATSAQRLATGLALQNERWRNQPLCIICAICYFLWRRFVRLTPNPNAAACLAGIALIGCAIFGTETYMWLQIDDLRRGTGSVVAPNQLARLHHLQTW